MLIIGYGIAAVIVIVLLIVFNVRTTSRRSRAMKEEEPPTPQAERTAEPIRESARTENAPAPVTEGPRRAIPERSAKKDQSYRNALRDLRAGAEQATKAPERKHDPGKMPDSDYRNAMRNLHSGSDKDKS